MLDTLYPLQLEYYDLVGNASVRLEWSSRSLPREVIDSRRFMCVPVCVCVCVCACVCVFGYSAHAYLHLNLSKKERERVGEWRAWCVWCACVRACMCVRVCVRVYTYTCTHAHLLTHVHTQSLSPDLSPLLCVSHARTIMAVFSRGAHHTISATRTTHCSWSQRKCARQHQLPLVHNCLLALPA